LADLAGKALATGVGAVLAAAGFTAARERGASGVSMVNASRNVSIGATRSSGVGFGTIAGAPGADTPGVALGGAPALGVLALSTAVG
jgi:hypothetical protein